MHEGLRLHGRRVPEVHKGLLLLRHSRSLLLLLLLLLLLRVHPLLHHALMLERLVLRRHPNAGCLLRLLRER